MASQFINFLLADLQPMVDPESAFFPLLPYYGSAVAPLVSDPYGDIDGELVFDDPVAQAYEEQRRQKYEAGPGKPGFTQGNVTTVSLTGNTQYQFVGDPNDPVLRWHKEILQVSAETGLPPALIAAVISKESSGNPQATGPVDPSTGARARGLMQIMDFNWEPGANVYDPLTNIRKGASMIAERIQWAKQKRPGISDQEAITAALASYLGDWDWDRMTFRGVSDVLGTDGRAYVNDVLRRMQQYQSAFQPVTSQASGNQRLTGQAIYGVNAPMTQGYGHTEFARQSGIYPNNFHDGIDIGVASGTRLTAPAAGTVVYAGLMGSYGGTVQIKLDNGYIVQLSHMRQINVNPGQRVDAGTLLGLSGGNAGDWGAGTSTGAHLHLRVLDPNGNSIDPRTLFII